MHDSLSRGGRALLYGLWICLFLITAVSAQTFPQPSPLASASSEPDPFGQARASSALLVPDSEPREHSLNTQVPAIEISNSQKPVRLSRKQLLLGIAAVSLVILICLLLLACHPDLQQLGWLQVQGLMLLRLKPGWPGEHPDTAGLSDIHAFEQRYRHFAQIYQPLGLKLSFSADGMRLEFQTPRPIPILRPGMPGRLQQELQDLVDALPAEKYLLQMQITGQIRGLRSIQHFSLASHEAQVGLHLEVKPRFSLKGVFFNG